MMDMCCGGEVKGEGLKTLFIYTRGKGKNPFFHFSDYLVFPKILKKKNII